MAANDFARRLLAWFDRYGRKQLPWQQEISPYRVWVSEVMLQQTQVTTVVPYFREFMARFPTISSLARADEDEVLHYWTGLGYYARARNLHTTAKQVTSEFGGRFPKTVEALTALPGIGRSTAGAIVSIACGGRAPILDGNVKRVLARCFAIDGWPGQTRVATRLWELAEELTPVARVADYTQAIMDLGATLCTRTSPRCTACPFKADCIARHDGRIDELPGKKPKKALPVKATCMLILENPAGEFLLEKRPNSGLWGGLWSFPECAPADIGAEILRLAPLAQDAPSARLAALRHTFTHFHLDITPIHVKLPTEPAGIAEADKLCWYTPGSPQAIGLARPVTKLIEQLEN